MCEVTGMISKLLIDLLRLGEAQRRKTQVAINNVEEEVLGEELDVFALRAIVSIRLLNLFANDDVWF